MPAELMRSVVEMDGASTSSLNGKVILIVDDDLLILEIVSRILRAAGLAVVTANDGAEALAAMENHRPDLVLSDIDMPSLTGLELLQHMRLDGELARVPVIFLSALGSTSDIVKGLELGADDYLTKPFEPAELVARVKAKLIRIPAPAGNLNVDPSTGLLTEASFREEMRREFSRFKRGGAPAVLAWISVHEMESIRLKFGDIAAAKAMQEIAATVRICLRDLDLVARTGSNAIWVLLAETTADQAREPLARVVEALTADSLKINDKRIFVTPIIGFSPSNDASTPDEWLNQASFAHDFAAGQQDLRPVLADERIRQWARSEALQGAQVTKSKWRSIKSQLRLPLQFLVTLLLGLALPFLTYVVLDRVWLDVSFAVYIVVVLSLVITGSLIWAEGFLAVRAPKAPEEPAEPYPAASAIIAAYLPNEAATIMDTIRAFLRQDYPGELQIVLAYNTPRSMPIELQLHELELTFPRFLALKVEGSTSKAQNVNAALERVTGKFVGLFDADHEPREGSFQRAWRWLSHGYDVVQGHCLVRNGDASWVARLVAVEFEAIYAVSHPGRTIMHGFGLFGGSNGFWRTEQLHRIRMRSTMLTEDIDSSMRVIESGAKIASDRALVSTELATVTFRQLWNQRMRWAQGWFQVSLRHLWPALKSRSLSVRQKAGMIHLLLWRELYVWLSLQVIPIVAFWIYRGGVDWFVPIFVITSIYTLFVGPGQAALAFLAADPEIKKQKWWFVSYLILSTVFYTELKNTIVRIAQVKEIMGERVWRVTPRPGSARLGDDAQVQPIE